MDQGFWEHYYRWTVITGTWIEAGGHIRYSNLRNAHIKQYYHRRPNVLKLVQLLSTTSIKELSNLGKYLERSNKLRNKLLEL